MLYPEGITAAHYGWLLLFGALGGGGSATFSVQCRDRIPLVSA